MKEHRAMSHVGEGSIDVTSKSFLGTPTSPLARESLQTWILEGIDQRGLSILF